MKALARRQQGATLLVTMVMLIMLTLLALSAMNSSTNNLRMVGNMQLRSEAAEVSQRVVEEVISTPRFASTPADALLNPCNQPNQRCTDVNNDGTWDLQTTLTPTPNCIQGKVIRVSDLRITGPNSEDVACVQAQQQGTFAVAGASQAGDSLCGSTVWEITSVTTPYGSSSSTADTRSGIVQGIGVRIPALDVTTSCPAN
jgi:Tfp pilus assembly protein PilX